MRHKLSLLAFMKLGSIQYFVGGLNREVGHNKFRGLERGFIEEGG